MAPSVASLSFFKEDFTKDMDPQEAYKGVQGHLHVPRLRLFGLHANRAFQGSRKQMQKADDIIENLLAEVVSLGEKPSGQIEEACQRASCAEEVARERRWHMLVELNVHCEVPVSTSHHILP